MNALDRLVLERASQTMTEGGFAAALANLASNKLGDHVARAREWVTLAIRAVREAPGGQAIGTDDQIAQRILDEIAEKRKNRPGGKSALPA